MITLVPAHLLEFRYFSPAVVIAMIYSSHTPACNMKKVFMDDRNHEKKQNCFENEKKTSQLFHSHPYLLLSLFTCFVIDVLVIFIFVYRPFNWVDNTVARFMF